MVGRRASPAGTRCQHPSGATIHQRPQVQPSLASKSIACPARTQQRLSGAGEFEAQTWQQALAAYYGNACPAGTHQCLSGAEDFQAHARQVLAAYSNASPARMHRHPSGTITFEVQAQQALAEAQAQQALAAYDIACPARTQCLSRATDFKPQAQRVLVYSSYGIASPTRTHYGLSGATKFEAQARRVLVTHSKASPARSHQHPSGDIKFEAPLCSSRAEVQARQSSSAPGRVSPAAQRDCELIVVGTSWRGVFLAQTFFVPSSSGNSSSGLDSAFSLRLAIDSGAHLTLCQLRLHYRRQRLAQYNWSLRKQCSTLVLGSAHKQHLAKCQARDYYWINVIDLDPGLVSHFQKRG